MKKVLSLSLVLMLVLSLLVSLTACDNNGGDKGKKEDKVDPIVGTWEAKIDMADGLNENLGEMSEFFDIDEFEVTFTIEFQEDGDYEIDADDKEYKAALKSIDFKKGMTKYLEALLEAEGVDMSVEEYLASAGMDLDELVDEAFSDEALEEAIKESETKGVYKVKGDKLYMAEDEDDFDDDKYIKIDIDDDELTFEEFSDEDDDDSDFAGLYPVTFEKTK